MQEFIVGEFYKVPHNSKGTIVQVNNVLDGLVYYTYIESGATGKAMIKGSWAQSMFPNNGTEDFYICWAPEGHSNPRVRLYSLEDAKRSAEHLIKNKGISKVYIMRSEAIVERSTTVYTEIRR